jgi:hypothetical protein
LIAVRYFYPVEALFYSRERNWAVALFFRLVPNYPAHTALILANATQIHPMQRPPYLRNAK